MGPGLGADGPCGHLLDRVVADGSGGAHPFLEVAGLDHLTIAARPVSPDSGETVGLQFQTDGEGVGLRLTALLLGGAHLA